ncbi:hypothetical protein [Aneurinibacillus migulanus]
MERLLHLSNSNWEKNSITIEDPDGWRIVLVNTNGI